MLLKNQIIIRMNRKSLLFVLLVFLFGCQVGHRRKIITGELLDVIDISKNYPKKEIHIQDIADIEYIALETTDEVLLSQASFLSYVSDKYIVIRDGAQSEVFIFNRNGTIASHFNRRGQGGEEYTMLREIVFDEKNEEIFILDIRRILVYSLSGEYKRTLSSPGDFWMINLYNFDDETMLVYDNFGVTQNSGYSEKPYYLMSKKDGSVISVLDIQLPVRYSDRIQHEIDLGGGEKGIIPLVIAIRHNRYFGEEFVIADISSDTIYRLFKNRDLVPILVRTPSVHLSEPRTVWTATLTTDKFMALYKVTLDFIAADKGRPVPDVFLVYEFESGETSEVTFVDVDYAMRRWYPPSGNSVPSISKNMTANLIQVPTLITAYQEKRLKGELEKFVETLDEDDNPIVRIIKFK